MANKRKDGEHKRVRRPRKRKHDDDDGDEHNDQLPPASVGDDGDS